MLLLIFRTLELQLGSDIYKNSHVTGAKSVLGEDSSSQFSLCFLRLHSHPSSHQAARKAVPPPFQINLQVNCRHYRQRNIGTWSENNTNSKIASQLSFCISSTARSHSPSPVMFMFPVFSGAETSWNAS